MAAVTADRPTDQGLNVLPNCSFVLQGYEAKWMADPGPFGAWPGESPVLVEVYKLSNFTLKFLNYSIPLLYFTA